MQIDNKHLYYILKAELTAMRPMMGTIGVPFVLICIAFVGWGRPELSESVPAMRAALVAAMAVAWVWEMTVLQKSKKIRFWLQLPMGRTSLGVARLIPLQLLALGFLMLYGICRLIAGAGEGLLLEFFLMLGITALANGLLQMYPDLMLGFHRPVVRYLAGAFYALTLLSVNMGFLMLSASTRQALPFLAWVGRLGPVVFSLAGCIVFIVVGVTVNMGSIALFLNRETYLE